MSQDNDEIMIIKQSKSTQKQDLSLFSLLSPIKSLRSICKSKSFKTEVQLNDPENLVILILDQNENEIRRNLHHRKLGADSYGYKVENWMANFQDVNFWDLVLPASHDTCTYRLHHDYYTLDNLIQTQKLTVYQQLCTGVRTLDIRVCWYQQNLSSPREYYCSHTFLTVPLLEVLLDIKRFLDEWPTEVIAIRLRPDAEFVTDFENYFHNGGFCHIIDDEDPGQIQDLAEYIMTVIPEEYFMDEVYMDTKIKDLIAKNQRIFMLLNQWALTKKSIPCKENSSWDITKSQVPSVAHNNCKNWLTWQGPKTETSFLFLDHQITMNTSKSGIEDIMKALIGGESLRGQAHASNQLLRDWLKDINKCLDCSKVNAILFDCVDEVTSRAIIDFNFKYQEYKSTRNKSYYYQ